MSIEPLYYRIDMDAAGQNITQLRTEFGLIVRDVQEIMCFTTLGAVYKWERAVSRYGSPYGER